MPNTGEYEIMHLKSYKEVFSAINTLRQDLYDQRYNDDEFVKNLAKKYITYAEVLSIKRDSIVKGICVFYDNDKVNKTAFLSMLVISKDEQGHGLGKILMREMFRICQENGMGSICLEVANSNNIAATFYKKMGYSLTQIRERTSLYTISIT